MVRKAGTMAEAFVLEVGPGPGGITRAILEQPCRRLDVVELDKQFIRPLEVFLNETNSEMKIAFELKNIGPLKSNLEFVDHNYNWMHFGLLLFYHPSNSVTIPKAECIFGKGTSSKRTLTKFGKRLGPKNANG
jgi:hypothetical protein